MIAIRPATTADLPGVLALWAEATTEATVTDDIDGLRALLDVAGSRLFVAVSTPDAIDGSLIAGWDGWRGSMYRLAVRPHRRRQGLALRLVAAGEQWLADRGCRRIAAIVVRDEEPATEFWSAAGYSPATNRTRFVKNA